MGKTSFDFQEWFDRVSHAPYLSWRMQLRYTSLLSRYADRVNSERRSQAFEDASICPFLSLRTMLNDSSDYHKEKSNDIARRLVNTLSPSPYKTIYLRDSLKSALTKAISTDKITVVGTSLLVDVLQSVDYEYANLPGYIENQAPLEQTLVPIHPDRMGRIVRLPNNESSTFVALRWSANSLHTRIDSQDNVVSKLLNAVNKSNSPIHFEVCSDYAWVFEPGNMNPWVIAPNLGLTIEDLLRTESFDPSLRRMIINALESFVSTMMQTGVIWGGFAPRNLFFSKGVITLIDFERGICNISQDQVNAANLLLWQRVWFSDCLTSEEAEFVFQSKSIIPNISPDTEILSDQFEKCLTGEAKITWDYRTNLLESTIRIEGQHKRSEMGFDSGILFGHQLGHFWGDFIDPRIEVKIFSFLRSTFHSDDSMLTSCLEVFEAAMEADIEESMLHASNNSANVVTKQTERLVSLLDQVSPEDLSNIRVNMASWYQELRHNPGKLIDRIFVRVNSQMLGIDKTLLNKHFMGDPSTRIHHEAELSKAVSAGCSFLYGDTRDEKFLQYKSPDELLQMVAEPLPQSGLAFEDVLEWFNNRIAKYSISQSDPRYLAFPDSGNARSAIAGALISSLLNQNLIAVDRSGPAATFLEIQVIEWLRQLVGYETRDLQEMTGVRDLAGLWTTGGHMSNHIAMLVALGDRFPDARSTGLQALPVAPAVVMSGPIAHYSHSDAAFHLGIGWNNVILVGAQENFTTSATEIDMVLTNPPKGKKPFLVVGVAGNCRTTGLDDLGSLAEVCKKHGVWFHVDACHGGNLLFSKKLKENLLYGIEQADSISIDPHKGLFTPYPSSYVLFKERGKLTQFSRHQSIVQEAGTWDLGLVMPFFGSRGFESLRTWFLIKEIGVNTLGDIVEHRQTLIRYLEKRVQECQLFIPFNDVDFYRLTFMFCPHDCLSLLADLSIEKKSVAIRILNQYTSKLNSHLYTKGLVCFDEHTLQDLGNRVGLGTKDKYNVMGSCPGNPLLTEKDIDDAFTILLAEARELADDLRKDLVLCQDTEEKPQLRGPAGWH